MLLSVSCSPFPSHTPGTRWLQLKKKGGEKSVLGRNAGWLPKGKDNLIWQSGRLRPYSKATDCSWGMFFLNPIGTRIWCLLAHKIYFTCAVGFLLLCNKFPPNLVAYCNNLSSFHNSDSGQKSECDLYIYLKIKV